MFQRVSPAQTDDTFFRLAWAGIRNGRLMSNKSENEAPTHHPLSRSLLSFHLSNSRMMPPHTLKNASHKQSIYEPQFSHGRPNQAEGNKGSGLLGGGEGALLSPFS